MLSYLLLKIFDFYKSKIDSLMTHLITMVLMTTKLLHSSFLDPRTPAKKILAKFQLSS